MIMSKFPEAVMLEAVRLLCKPLASFCIRHAVKIQEFSEIFKQVFVNEAISSLNSSKIEPNVSKVAAVTGLQRRDVMRLLQADVKKSVPASLHRKIIGQWLSDKKFSNLSGKPKILSFEGRESEFSQLVQEVSQDLNPYTVLFELERIGAVMKTPRGLKLISQVFVPKGDIKRGFELTAGDISDLLRAAEENVSNQDNPPHLHIKTHYDNIQIDAVPKIQAWIREKGRQLHEEARTLLSSHDKDINEKLATKPGGVRVALGTFSLTEIPEENES